MFGKVQADQADKIEKKGDKEDRRIFQERLHQGH